MPMFSTDSWGRPWGADGLRYVQRATAVRYHLLCRQQTFWQALMQSGLAMALRPRWERPVMVETILGGWRPLGERKSISSAYEFKVDGCLRQGDLEMIQAFAKADAAIGESA